MKNLLRTLMLMILCCLPAVTGVSLSHAQTQVKASGTVTDTKGNPLPGVGVITRSNEGTITDLDGKWALTVLKGSELEFSSLGYETVTLVVNDSKPISVVLKDDTELLEEVVVVGYGTQSRKTLATSISKVDGSSIAETPVSSVGDALKGKVPGLRVATSNALSGEAPRFMVRGGSSISMGNDPIYIVDGSLRDDLQGVNTNDIESIEVLKDAASAGIYGARASNGVILVTTKKGSPSQGPEIVFMTKFGIQSPVSRWETMGSREYLSFIRPAIAAAMANDKEHPASALLSGPNAYGTGNTDPKSLFSTRYLDWGQPVPEGYSWMMDPVNPDKVLIFTDTDYQGQWFSNAFWHNEYVGVNGGSDRMKYAASASYTDDDGIIAMSDYTVFTMHGNASFKITNNLEASATFDLSRQKKHIPVDNYYQCFGRGVIAAPTAMEKNHDGEWNQLVATNKNAHSASWYETYYRRQNATTRMSGTMGLKWDIIKGLTASAQYNFFEQGYAGSYYAIGEVDGVINSVSASRSMTQTRSTTRRNTFTAHLSFRRSFAGSHNVSALAGYEFMNEEYDYVQGKSSGSVSDDVPVLQSGINFSATNRLEREALISYFGRVGYDYKNRYIASATFRADGSSKFAEGNRWGYFPAGSAAWVISEEPFFRKAANTVNTLKLRASYGLTGNNGIGLYDTYGSFTTGAYGDLSTLTPTAMQNSSMRWETTSQFDVGIDVGLYRDRVRFLFDYYNKVTDNMLFSIELPDTSPYSSVKANVGSARFYGWEAELHLVNIQKKNFSWSTDFTVAYSQNKVLSLPEEYAYDEVDINGFPTGKKAYRIGGYKMSESGYRYGGIAVGEPLGRIYGYQVDHIIQTMEDADNALYDTESKGFRVSDGKRITGRKDVGDYEWCNMPGSARGEKGEEIINAEDMFYLGNVVPNFVGGINNTFMYKGLTFSFYFDYALGHSLINGMKTHMVKNTMGDCNSILGNIVYDCWSGEGDTDAKYARYTPNDSDWGNRNWRGPSSFMVEKADYLCLRDVSLFWNLPQNWLSKVKMKGLQVGVTGNTLFYWSNVTGAVSPESGISSSSDASMYEAVSTANSSSDNRANIVPSARKIIFSLKLTF